ncbi:putative plant intracellular Ras-group-related LRR protein 1-like [Cocos nucifera]|uniref:Putative plant intracellular Ras-group-related LRR protein 1-like n=1 Tax=Cocos nucifera TaxID=13894 RepID=A0A8K0N9X8_COCNU|nr:putative plant intracellular Ras-group-related LRR protein 1-like [Cocos nucifera]
MEGRKRVEKNTAQKVKDKAQKVDLSGMSLNTLSNPAMEFLCITKLDLSNNNLESIPESLTARLLNLEVLDVHSNQLKALPNSIGCLTKLKVFNVSSNLLVSLPKAIENCCALEELNANFNQLTRLPDTMGYQLTNLRTLSVNSNKLAFLPSSTSHLTSLRSLDAHLNCLSSLPDGLENLIRLHSLNLSHNFHHLCTLPFSLGLLTSLTDLDVSYNNLTALPSSLGCLTNLRALHVEGNPLVSPPMEVVHRGVEAMREYLSARMNYERAKTDGLPSTKTSFIRKLVKCTTFSGRRLSTGSSLPDGLENLIRLHSLNLSHNFHHLCTLPFSLGLLTSLTDLDVSYNNLTALPSSLGCLTNLRALHVEGNPLVSPPMEVVHRGVEAMREYLSARMNYERAKTDGLPSTKTSFIRKLVKCTTFSGRRLSTGRLDWESGESLLSDYRVVKGFATPEHAGTFSPRRLFSSRRSQSLKL